MKLVSLTHANHKDTIAVSINQIYAMYISPNHACTHVVATGGAIVPVQESPEKIKSLIEKTQKENNTNDTTTR